MRIVLTRGFVVILAGLMVFCRSAWLDRTVLVPPVLLMIGLVLIGAAMAGRIWCSLFIAGYKDKRLLREGPYSVCRHPLYFFSFLGAVGVAMGTGTLAIPALIAAVFALYYPRVMAAEEEKLNRVFGEEFAAYRREVPAFFPRWSLLRQPASWTAHPPVIAKHLLSVLWFAPAIGVVFAIAVLREALGWPVLCSLF